MKKQPAILALSVMLSLSPLSRAEDAHIAALEQDSPSLVVEETAGSIQRATSDTHFVAIDLVYVEPGATKGSEEGAALPGTSRGVEPSPFILWRNDITHESGGWIMTLDHLSGAQMGSRLEVGFPELWYPVDVLWVRHFQAFPDRGVEPSPFILFRNYHLRTFPVTYSLDGTPVPGSSETFSIAADSMLYGHPTCIAELPGAEFDDGQARLFIGTDQGYILVLVFAPPGGVGISDILSISAAPIVTLQPMPQYDYIALGVLAGNVVRGIHYDAFGSSSFTVVFHLVDLREPDLEGFDSFGPDDARLPDSESTLRLVLANGTPQLALSTIEADQTGLATLALTLDQHELAIKSAVTGSLLMLGTNESAVMFDPNYSQETGSSSCDLDIGDTIADYCEHLCGDADGSGEVDIDDVVYLINYIFTSGPPPDPIESGDADCSGGIDIDDVVWLIAYIFSGGNAPCDTDGDEVPDC
jgi:hypothetical protein